MLVVVAEETQNIKKEITALKTQRLVTKEYHLKILLVFRGE